MKILFQFSVDEEYQNYAGDEKLTDTDYFREVKMDWILFELPVLGDLFQFQYEDDSNSSDYDHYCGREFKVIKKTFVLKGEEIVLEIYLEGGEK